MIFKILVNDRTTNKLVAVEYIKADGYLTALGIAKEKFSNEVRYVAGVYKE